MIASVLKKILSVSPTLALAGCGGLGCCLSVPLADGTAVHHVILGIGVVTVPKADNRTAVFSTKTQAIGLSLSDQPGLKMGIGYSASNVVAIPENAEDVRVEISQRPGGPLTIDTQKATLSQK